MLYTLAQLQALHAMAAALAEFINANGGTFKGVYINEQGRFSIRYEGNMPFDVNEVLTQAFKQLKSKG